MKNIEIKAKCSSLKELKAIVLKNGGRFEKTMHHIDTYFVVPQGRLKLREIDDTESVLIFYERSNSADSKESNYYLHKTNDPASLKDFLSRSLGTKVIVDKIRELYILENTRIHLDTVKDLGTFMELETVVSVQSDEEAYEENKRIVELLKISKDDLLEVSYSDLLLS